MRELREYERVKINNIYPWEIGFSSGYSGQTVIIAPNAKEDVSLTVESVRNAINNQNIACLLYTSDAADDVPAV